MKPNRSQVIGVLRHILTLVGGALLVSNGWISDAEASEAIGAICTLVGVGWSVWEKRGQRPPGGDGGAAAPLIPAAAGAAICILLLPACILGTGCARFRTVQRDISIQTNGTTRTIETTATATTLAAGKQALAQWKATQSDKSQGASVGSVNQESDASGLLQGLMGLGRLLYSAQSGGVVPGPVVVPAPAPRVVPEPEPDPADPPPRPAARPASRPRAPSSAADASRQWPPEWSPDMGSVFDPAR